MPRKKKAKKVPWRDTEMAQPEGRVEAMRAFMPVSGEQALGQQKLLRKMFRAEPGVATATPNDVFTVLYGISRLVEEGAVSVAFARNGEPYYSINEDH